VQGMETEGTLQLIASQYRICLLMVVIVIYA